MKNLLSFILPLLLIHFNFCAEAQVAGFTVDHVLGCVPLTVNFTNTSTGATGYIWDFGNLTPTVSSVNPTTVYYAVQVYTVTLTAYAGVDSSKFSQVITVYPNPVASFYAADTAGCPGLNVAFTNTSDSAMPGPMNYSWTFGDGNSSTLASPSNTYMFPGYKTVSLQVTNSAGCRSRDTFINSYIDIYTPASVSFHVSDSFFCRTPGNVNFFNTTTGLNPLTYTWEFGDGNTSTFTNPAYIYTNTGSYPVTLKVTDGHSCVDSLNYPGYINIGTLLASYRSVARACIYLPDTFFNTSVGYYSCSWDFGDGNTSNILSPAHTYTTSGTFNVTLVVTNGVCNDTLTDTIQIEPLPQGNFSMSPVVPCLEGNATFTASVTPGSTVKWLWGDDTMRTGETVSRPFNYIYVYPNKYGIIDYTDMIITSSFGCIDTVSKIDTLYYLTESVFTGPSDPCIPDTVTFGTQIAGPVYNALTGRYIAFAPAEDYFYQLSYPYPVLTYSWDFDDGSPLSSAATPTHIYTATGNFHPSCTVTTPNGCTQSAGFSINIGTRPVASYTISPSNACAGAKITFTSTSTGGTGIYTWQFGDGTNGPNSESIVYHSYTIPGIHPTSLIVFNGDCPSTIAIDTVTIDSPGAVMHIDYICNPRNEIVLHNESFGADSVEWIFGDGTSPSSDFTAPHTYASLSTYVIHLIAYNSGSGCLDTAIGNIDLRKPQVANWPKDTGICRDIRLDTFLSTFVSSLAPVTYKWYVNGSLMDSLDTMFVDNFHNRGRIPVTLVVNDEYGCNDSAISYVTVAKPIDSFSFYPVAGCSPLTVSYTDLSTDVSGATITNYSWSFGDGVVTVTRGPDPAETYYLPTSYSVQEIVTDQFGCRDTFFVRNGPRIYRTIASFTLVSSTVCAGVNIKFTNTSVGAARSLWFFGDGDTSAVTSPYHIYTTSGTFSPSLVVFDSIGCSDTFTIPGTFTVNPSPHSSFTMDDSFAVCPPLAVNFSNYSTGCLSYGFHWYFGEGDSSTAFDPSWFYTLPAEYTVRLVSTNSYGCTDTAVGHARIFGYSGAFTYTPIHGCSPDTVVFNGGFSGSVSGAEWDFGDGVTYDLSLSDTITHVYSLGAYMPKLILSDTLHHCPTTFSFGLDTIKADTLTPVFAVSPNPGCQNGTVVFHDESFSHFSLDTAWYWTFGTGDTSTASTPDYIYTANGTFSAAMLVSNQYGCNLTVSNSITVNPSPSQITGTFTICAGTSTTLSDSVSGGFWSTGSAMIAVGSTGIVTGVLAGSAFVTYTLPGGCWTTAIIHINPVPNVITGNANICTGATSYLGDMSFSGIWTSSNSAIATVGSTSGLVSGISAGTVVISYSFFSGNTCGSYKTVTVNPLPVVISGPTLLCSGLSYALSDSVDGGTWSSSNLSVARFGSVAGEVTGVSPGTAQISYTIGVSCRISTSVQVLPLGAINGSLSICDGFATSLTDAMPAGTWSSSNTGVAVIGSSGLVASVTAGTSIISYTLSNGCAAGATVTVYPLPAVITGNPDICLGFTSALSDSGSGTWSSSGIIVTIGSASGIVTGLNRGTALVTYTLPTGCLTTTSVLVVPLPAHITGDSAICNGALSTLHDATSTGAWTTGDSLVVTVAPTTGLITGVSAGTALISYTVNSCPVSEPITVYPVPSPVSGLFGCVGLTSMFTDSSTGGYWVSGSTGVATIGSTSGIATGVSAGTYIVSYVFSTGCLSSLTQTIFPVPPAISGPSALCSGDSTRLTDSLPGGTWLTLSTGIVSVDPALGSVTAITTGTALITYQVSGCPVYGTLIVNPLPGPINGPDSLCAGTSARIYDTTIRGGNWTVSGTATSIDSTGLLTGLSGGMGLVTYSLPTSCFVTRTTTVISAPPPISGAYYVCLDSTITLVDASPGGFWSTSSTDVNVGSGNGLITGMHTGSATITYTLPPGCMTIDTIDVNPQVLPVTGPVQVCVGSGITLSDSTLYGMGAWLSGNTAIATAGSASGIVTGVSEGLVNITYAVTNGCGITVATHTVFVNPLPVPGAITGPTLVCQGANITLEDTTGGPGTWSSLNNKASVAGGIVTGIHAGPDTIIHVVSNICGIDTAFHGVDVDSLPVVGVIAGSGVVCLGSAVTLTDSTPSGTWSNASPVVSVLAGTVTGVTLGTTTISYQVSNTCGTSVVTHTMSVITLPNPGVITGDSSVCSGHTIQLHESVADGAWSSTNSLANIDSVGDVSGIALGVDTIYYAVTNMCGTKRAKLTITVDQTPPAVHIVTFPDSTLCVNSLFQNFGADTTEPPGVAFTWSAQNASVYASSPQGQYCLVDFNAPGYSIVKLTAGTLGTDCITTDSISYDVGGFYTPQPGVVYYEPELVCTDNTSEGYQWGYDDAVTLDSTLFPGEINQNYYNPNLDLLDKFYWVLTYHNGCIQKSYYNAPLNVTVYGADGMVKILMYPNPAGKELHIAITGLPSEGETGARVFDVLGREAEFETFNGNTVTIPLTALAAGVYQVVLSRDGRLIGSGNFIKK